MSTTQNAPTRDEHELIEVGEFAGRLGGKCSCGAIFRSPDGEPGIRSNHEMHRRSRS